MMKNYLSLIGTVFLVLGVACSGSDSGDTPDAAAPDAAAVDAAVPVDAGCQFTMCGEECINTAESRVHCGECDNECVFAEECTESSCSCAEISVPAELEFIATDSNNNLPEPYTAYFGAFFNAAGLNVLLIGYDLDQVESGGEYTLAPPSAEEGATPNETLIGYGYKVNMGTEVTIQSLFFAVSGTIIFDSVCAEGASGTLKQAFFFEIDVEAQAPTSSMCSFMVEETSFAVGAACPDPEPGDAGPMADAM